MSREQEPVATAKERTTTISGNSGKSLQTRRKHNNRTRPENNQRISIGKFARLLPPFLNQDILKLPIKTPSPIPSHIRKEMTHSSETK
jgi:hypothetical protein